MNERFKKVKEAVLGKRYELSFSFITEGEMRRLNRIYRGKDKATDILSFPLTKSSGEIVICKSYASKKAKLYGRKRDNFIDFLFIHGLVHLKGFDHGDIMEKEEEKYRKRFGI